jgi:hypothetical protein
MDIEFAYKIAQDAGVIQAYSDAVDAYLRRPVHEWCSHPPLPEFMDRCEAVRANSDKHAEVVTKETE